MPPGYHSRWRLFDSHDDIGGAVFAHSWLVGSDVGSESVSIGFVLYNSVHPIDVGVAVSSSHVSVFVPLLLAVIGVSKFILDVVVELVRLGRVLKIEKIIKKKNETQTFKNSLK